MSDDPDYITYERLISSRWTDHVVHFKWLFERFKIKSLLEFGLGEGTKFFLDYCEKVTSVEMVTRNVHEKWFHKCKRLYREYPHWDSHLYRCDEAMLLANLDVVQKRPPDEKSYVPQIKALCDELLQEPYDVAFIDPGHYLRKDLVQALFGRIPIIAAHDTNIALYGWDKIDVPPNYETFSFAEGKGTIFWILSK